MVGPVYDTDKLNELYLAADMLIFPSLSEGTPKVIPEAMSRGVVPIAVENVGSINSIISHGVNGYLVPPKSPDAVAECIMDYVNNPKTREDIRLSCYKYAELHTIEAEVEKMMGFILDGYHE